MSSDLPVILVASATAKTGAAAVQVLSESGKVQVRALTRDPESASAKPLAGLPRVEVVKGDFADAASVEAALKGVSRVFLVSPAGLDEQFDVETGFIAAAVKAGVEGIFRISTASSLISLESTGVYARAHARIEKFIEETKAPVVDGNPNWFLHNLLGSAGEAKATGKISLPVRGDGRPFAMVDPRDVGAAGAAILLTDKAKFAEFLALGRVEINGPALHNFNDQAAAISAAAGGKPLEINTVPADAWVQALVGAGMSEYFARSFKDTVLICAGEKETSGRPVTEKSSDLLLEIWQPTRTLEAWAKEFSGAFFA